MLKDIRIRIPFKINDENRICDVLCMLQIGLYIVNISPGVEQAFGIDHEVISAIIKLILGLGFIFCIDILFRRFKRRTISYCIITVIVILVSVVAFPSNNVVFKNTVVYFLGNCFLPFIFWTIVRDFECLKRKMVKTAEIIAVLSLIVLLLSVGVVNLGFQFSLGKYSMGFGYSCLVPWLFIMMEFMQKPTFKQGVFAIVIFMAVMSLGSRGPLVGMFAFVIIAFVKINHENKKDVRIAIGFLAGIIFLLFSNSIFIWLYNYLYGIGINSRTLALLSYDIGHKSGRDKIYAFFLKEIFSHPFAIHGINGEQALGYNYPHNMVLELLYQFGIVFGGLIIVAIAIRAIKILKASHINKDAKQQMEIIFLCASLPSLMISGTLWTQSNFWTWLAVSINRINVYPKKQRGKI